MSAVATWAGVAALGGGGALARFVVDRAVAGGVGRSLPFGTFAVNVTGAVALGLVTGLGARGDTRLLAATAALGSYTTFSTWMLESHRLAEDGRLRLGVVNLLASLVAGVAVAWLGRQIGGAL